MGVNRDILLAIEWQRLKRRWSKARAAREIGMTTAAYSNLVNGQTGDVMLSTLQKIADGFDTTLEVVIGDGYPPEFGQSEMESRPMKHRGKRRPPTGRRAAG